LRLLKIQAKSTSLFGARPLHNSVVMGEIGQKNEIIPKIKPNFGLRYFGPLGTKFFALLQVCPYSTLPG
jgi:hypothetical protein